MIARDEDAAAAFVEACDGLTFFAAQSTSGVDREEPQLIEIGLIDASKIFLFIAAGYVEAIVAETRMQFGKSGTVPVVARVGNRGLQQDFQGARILRSCGPLLPAP